MKENKNILIRSINNQLIGTTVDEIKKKRGGVLKYPVYMNKEFMEMDVTELDLTVRSLNSLKRAGFHSVGELVNNINGPNDLLGIRNCGKKSADEIMGKIFLLQYSMLSPERRKKYLEQVVELNRRGCYE